MINSWLVLLPPFIVLACAFITKRLNLSLAIGVLSGALIASDFSLLGMFSMSLNRLWQVISDIENIYMFSFLFMISIIVVLLNRTGAANAFAQRITSKLTNARAAETASILLSFSLFIDDYLSNLTVGYVMRPITDRLHIPRAKLAFLVHSLTSPLIILAPISSWVAAITSTLDQAGITPEVTPNTKIIGDPFFIYLEAIPYIFYSFLTIASIWFIVRLRLSYGPMHNHEEIAQTTGNLFGGKEPLPEKFESVHPQGSIADLLLPLITLIGSVIVGSLWAGGYYLFGGTRGFLDAFKYNTQIFFVLFISGIISLTTSYIFALVRNKIKIQDTPSLIRDGIDLMYSAVLMVILAFTLGKILSLDLQTGKYLASLLQGTLPVSLLPLIFFIIATITSMLTGSAWGTMMILIPIAIPMLITLSQVAIPAMPENIALLLPVLGAIFSGSVCGNHLSPISETTIMASQSSGAYPLDHAHTQFPYAIPAIICSALAFLLTGLFARQSLIFKLVLPLAVSLILCFILLYAFNRLNKNLKS
jgi:Na+/H+ antiporter NhaC